MIKAYAEQPTGLLAAAFNEHDAQRDREQPALSAIVESGVGDDSWQQR